MISFRIPVACLAMLACADAFAAAPVVEKEIPYVPGGHPNQTFDLYLPPVATIPATPGARPLPLVIWIHGGAWKLGSKDWITVRYLVEEGFAIASIGYRFSQDAIFPAQIQDCNAALDFLLKNAGRYGIDRRRVVVGGGSAGGHLALLLGLARNEKSFGANPGFRPRAVLDFFGVSEISSAKKTITDPAAQAEIDSIYRQLLGSLPAERPDLAKAASPISYVGKDSPPVLLVHGDRDEMVPLGQSRSLQSALDRAGVPNQLFIVPGAGHDGPMFASPAVRKEVTAFLKQTLASSVPERR